MVLSNRGSGDGDTVLVISYGITALSGFWRPEGSMPGYLTSGRSSFLCMVPLDKPQSTSIHRTKWKTSYSVDDNKKMLVNN